MSRHRPHHVEPRVESARVFLVYKSSDPHAPSHVGLGVTAACTAKTLRRHGIWAEVWPCSSGQHLLERLRHAHDQATRRQEPDPTHVVIHAPWILTAEIASMAREFPNVVFSVVTDSNFGFLAADPHAVRLLRETVELQQATHNVRVAGNCLKFTRAASDIWGVRVAYLPNLYDLSEPQPRHRGRWPGDSLRIGLFGAARLLKNGLTAAAAAAELAATLRVPTELHVSTARGEEITTRAIEELTEGVPNLRLVHAGWLPWPKFRKLVAHMHVLLQPSFTESFNVVTADGVVEGVPSVVTEAIDWAPARWQANGDDAGDVARVAEYLLHNPHAVEDGRQALADYIESGIQAWRRFLVPRT